jgi:hypothetical protein
MMMFIISCDEINFVYFFWWPFHGCKSMMMFIISCDEINFVYFFGGPFMDVKV